MEIDELAYDLYLTEELAREDELALDYYNVYYDLHLFIINKVRFTSYYAEANVACRLEKINYLKDKINGQI